MRITRSLAIAVVVLAGMLPAQAEPVIPDPVPRAECGPGSIPESGIQGRVTADDYAAGTGARCNVELVGRVGDAIGGFRVHRYVDPHGNECGYYDTSSLVPSDSSVLLGEQATGTFVVDMDDPSNPVITMSLDSPAMRSPHESLSLHEGRGLLAAGMGHLVTATGFVDIYDLTKDCRRPELLASLPVGVLGHEGTFSPDGMTYWVTNPTGFFIGSHLGGIAAVDVSEPRAPRLLWTSTAYTPHGLNLSADGNTLYFADMSPTPGLTVLDVSDVQARALNPQVTVITHETWDTVSIPQTNLPVQINGRDYLIEVDEFTSNTLEVFLSGGSFSDPAAMVGAARIIDVANAADPRIVSDIRLEVHQPEARAGAQANDPGAESAFGYAAHYCAVPRAVEPGIVACSFILSGLRVFDISDPMNPTEIAYFNPPTTTGQPYNALSAPAFAPERNEIWYSDGNYGFFAVRVTNGAWTP